MSFEEAKHKRGGKGTQQGGKFVAQGQTGTPTQQDQSAEATHAAMAPFHTPEQHQKYIAYVASAKQEQVARKQLKQATKQAHGLLQQAAQAPTSEAKAGLIAQAERATQQVQALSTSWKSSLDAFVKQQHEYAESFKKQEPPNAQ